MLSGPFEPVFTGDDSCFWLWLSYQLISPSKHVDEFLRSLEGDRNPFRTHHTGAWDTIGVSSGGK